MQFTFKRDEEGTERIYVGDVLVGAVAQRDGGAHIINTGGVYDAVPGLEHDLNASIAAIEDAYGRADEAGFWSEHLHETGPCESQWLVLCPHEVTVDVPIAETAATLTLVSEGDES